MTAPTTSPTAAARVAITVVFINAGRGPAALVARLWGIVARVAHRGADVVLAVEVDEGDHPANDHSTLRRLLHGWRRWAWRFREVIVTRADLKVRGGGSRRAGVGMPHWSPPRRVSWRVVVGRPVTGFAAAVGRAAEIVVGLTHYAAAQDNGRRPTVVVRKLAGSQKTTRLVVRWLCRRAQRQGRHLAFCLDENKGGLDRFHPDQVVLFADRPDYGFAVPAPGWHVVDVDHQKFPNPLEPSKHDGHVVTVTFEENQ